VKILHLFETGGLRGNFCWRRRRMPQEWQKHFSFDQANSAGIVHLCRSCEAADYPCKTLKTFVLHANLQSLRVHLLVIHISVRRTQINCTCSQVSITACKLCHQDCQTCTKGNSSLYILSMMFQHLCIFHSQYFCYNTVYLYFLNTVLFL